MDLTPPSLTRSPSSSPPHTYCPSETSSVDYPSPDLVAQQYRITSIYGVEPACSMAQQMDPDGPLPPLDAMEQAEWGAATVLHATTSASAMSSALAADYEQFANYSSPLPASFGNDLYASHASRRHSGSASPLPPPPAAGAPPRPPALPSSRTSVSYHSTAPAIPGHLTPRMKMETPAEYAQQVEMSHYPSPRPVPASYSPDSSGYPAAAAAYIGGDQTSAWAKHDYPAAEPDLFFASAASQAPGLAPDPRRPFRVVRPRRAPRRLTTKEEANYQCEVRGCGKLFSRSYNFKAHMETHDEKREYPFPCTVGDCGKKFVRKTDLQRHHQSVHMKERNHKCDYCGRMFARKDTLRRHMEDGCSKRFDIGTVDLRAGGYDTMNTNPRALAAPISHMIPSSGALPPMSMPPLGSSGLLAPVTPTMRARDVLASGGQSHGQAWLRQ